MSFAYKTLKGSDISISPYVANKQYAFPSNSLSSSGIVVYTGEYNPQYIISGTVYNAFDPINDIKDNGYYRRLIFDSIQKLYYQNYISGSQSGSFFVSSAYDNYDQTTLASGAFSETVVKLLPTITSSLAGIYNSSSYSASYYAGIYDSNALIRVISIPQDIYGNGLQPGTFIISSSTYYIRDDGQGNLWDYITSGSIYNQDPYNDAWYAGTDDTKIYVGNIVYSPGFAIITNPDYLCFYPTDPIALNDSYTFLNVSSSKVLDILANDFDDCNEIDDATVMTYPLAGYTFPSYSIVGGEIHITDCGTNYLQVTPGTYKLLYTVNNNKGATSNLATCSLNITADPFTSSLISFTSGCWGDVASQSVTFSANLGIPPYSWSLNNINYTPLSSCALYQPTFSIVVPTADNVNIYLKDSIGSIMSYSLDTQLFPIIPNSNHVDTCLNQSTGIISASATGGNPVNALSASIQSGSYNSGYFPLVNNTYVFNGLNSGSYTVTWKDNNNCTTSSTEVITVPPPISITLNSVEADCPGGTPSPNGGIAVTVSGGSGTYNYRWTGDGGNTFVRFVEDPVGLSAGNYELYVSDSTGCNKATSSIITIGSVTAVSLTGLNVVSSSCYGISGGGSITGSINNGSGSLYYSWAGPSGYTNTGTSSYLPYPVNIGNLSTGSYTLTVTDSATGCNYSFGPYVINEPTEFKSGSFTINRGLFGNPYTPYYARFNFQGGTLDAGGGYTASLYLSSSAGLSLQYTISASSIGSQQIWLTQSCLTASTNWVLLAIDDKGCVATNVSPSYYISLAPQVVQQVPVCYTSSFATCGCNVGSVSTIYYLSASYSTSSLDILSINDLLVTGGINGDVNALLWENCNQTTTASIGSYWNGSNLYANIGLGTSIGGFVNDSDPCAISFPKTITTYITNGSGDKVTSWTELDYTYSGFTTSSGVFFLGFNGYTSTTHNMPVPPGQGAYEISASLGQALSPSGNIIVSITVTSGSSTGYESTLYDLYSNTFVGSTEASFTSAPLFTTASLNYIVNIEYTADYGSGGIIYCQDAFNGGPCNAYVGCACPPGYTETGCPQPTPC